MAKIVQPSDMKPGGKYRVIREVEVSQHGDTEPYIGSTILKKPETIIEEIKAPPIAEPIDDYPIGALLKKEYTNNGEVTNFDLYVKIDGRNWSHVIDRMGCTYGTYRNFDDLVRSAGVVTKVFVAAQRGGIFIKLKG